jgi:cytochrome c peroxidase
MRFRLLALAAAISLQLPAQHQLRFPPISVGAQEALALHVIGLGGRQSRCQGAAGFRDSNGEPVGPSQTLDLAIGRSAYLRYTPAGGAREQIRPIVEVPDSSSPCFAAMELQPGFSVAYLAAVKEPLVHPADHAFASFVEAQAGDLIRLLATRIEGSDAACRMRVQFRDSRGAALGASTDLTPEPGKVLFADLDPALIGAAEGQTVRVIVDLEPQADDSAAGCLVAAEIILANGYSKRYIPLSVRRSAEAAAPPPTRSRSASIPTPAAESFPIGAHIQPNPPLGLPPLPVPDDNPLTAETIALGRRLYYDPVLSRDATVSCASCHDPVYVFRDPRRVSQGVNGLDGERQSMSIFNAAYAKEVFWDGRAPGLERQAFGPVESPVEFAFSHRRVEHRLEQSPSYVEQFAQAFGPGRITYEKAAKSIAAFQRTVLSGNSPFDKYQYGGDRNAMTPSAINGIGRFLAGNCTTCHSMGDRFATFSDDAFHNTGVAAIAFDQLSDQGRWKVTGEEKDRGAFRPPTLRNITVVPKLMHNGSMTLGAVADFYGRGGNINKWISPLLIAPGPAPPQIIQETTEFLNALTGEMPEHVGPPE